MSTSTTYQELGRARMLAIFVYSDGERQVAAQRLKQLQFAFAISLELKPETPVDNVLSKKAQNIDRTD